MMDEKHEGASFPDSQEDTAPGTENPLGAPDNVNGAQATEDLAVVPDRVESEEVKDVLHFDPDAKRSEKPKPAEAPEQILFLKQMCIRTNGAECDRCASACPLEAIFIDQAGVHIDRNRCTRCGICYGICDGFTSSQITMADMRTRIRRMAMNDKRLFITCRENIFDDMEIADNVLVVPCLAALPPELLCAVLADGIRVIIAGSMEYCDDCTVAPERGEALYSFAIETAQSWSGKNVEFTEIVPEVEHIADRINRSDRREAFAGLVSSVGEVASGNYRKRKNTALQEFEARREQMRANAWQNTDYDHPLNIAQRERRRRRTLFPRRSFLIEALQADPRIGYAVELTVSETDANSCCHALDCVARCPTGARSADAEGRLTYDARYCIGCGLCMQACRQGACGLHTILAAELGERHNVAALAAAPDPETPQDEPQNTPLDAEQYFAGSPDEKEDRQ